MADVASDLIANIEGYQQLLTTLSLGTAAGAFAIVVQVILHNSSNTKPVVIENKGILIFGIIALFLSILGGVATKSVLVSAVPAIHAIQWGTDSALDYLSRAGISQLRWMALWQIFSFIVGIAAMLFVLIRNVHQMK